MLLRAATCRIAWLLVSLCLAVAPPAAGQFELRPLDVRGLQSLRFGDVLAGSSMTVDWEDASQAGTWVARGERNGEVVLTLTLPNELVGPGGALMRITFAPNDAAYLRGNSSRPLTFDPTVPYLNTLGSNGRCRIFLGGTVHPSFSQTAGFYRADVTLTVTYTGN